jgi:hypothetical protein
VLVNWKLASGLVLGSRFAVMVVFSPPQQINNEPQASLQDLHLMHHGLNIPGIFPSIIAREGRTLSANEQAHHKYVVIQFE